MPSLGRGSAAAMYSDLMNEGEATAALYYNLGDAEFRLGHKGKALLAYERSLQISPRDTDTRWNIDVVKSILTDRLETSGDLFWIYWLKKGSAWVTLNEISLVFTGILLILFFQVLVNFIFPKIGRLLWIPQTLTLVLAAALLAFGLFKYFSERDPRAVILDKEAFARYGPSETETKAFLLHEGALVRVSDQSRDWLYITLNNKNSGWIRKESCELV